MATCGLGGSTRWFYTGNQVGWLNFTGDYNFVAGGPPGSGISAGTLVSVFFPPPVSREPWNYPDAKLSQELLDNCYPFIELNWIADITLGDKVFRVSDKNVYVQDRFGAPRFYEARVQRGPKMTVTTGEWLNPNFEIGDMNFTINNRDGYFNEFLANGENYKQWIYAKCEIRLGFGEKYENYYTIFTGYVAPKQGVSATDTDITIKAYDRFDKDEVPLPPLFFNEINYPDLQHGVNGKGVPLIYGDWETDVDTFGDIPAFCLNAKESDPAYYIFKVSANSLTSLQQVWLHRGNRNSDHVDGPIRFDMNQLIVFLDRGEFWIPTQIPVLLEAVTVMDRTQAGSGSGVGIVTSDKPDENFITKGVKPGDQIIKTKTSETATILSVASNQLILVGGAVTFAQGDEYGIRTTNFTFRKGDKFSLTCKGKNIQRISKNRLADAGLTAAEPIGLSVGLDGTWWFADDSTQKIYKMSFYDEVLFTLDYSDVDASITSITGVTIQTDNTLWMYDPVNSKFWRFNLEQMATGLNFRTIDVPGMPASLGDGRGLTIDTGNLLYIVDNVSGTFYVINPFTPFHPTLVASWNRSAFDAAAIEILDLSADVNQLNLLVVDRATQKYYRINNTTGALISQGNLSEVSDTATWVVGVSTAQDGTVFFLNRADLTLYNFNEDPDSMHNPGFIARDIIQSQTGKVMTDFDLSWNETSRLSLNQYRARLFVQDKFNAVSLCNKLLQQFNAGLYIRFNRYALFHINFPNFRTDGKPIREGDIKENSFNAAKEYNQYFNSAFSEYSKSPFSGKSVTSDTYVSPSGVAAAGREISRKFSMEYVYRRADVDKLMPLFVRLAAAEPEFISMDLTWRRIFTQPFDFYNINFFEPIDCTTGKPKGGRRYENIPCFVRQCEYDLDMMTVKVKVWSLGTTAFGDFIPKGGLLAGGEDDKIVLTNLGTVGYIAPVGTITASGPQSVTLADVAGQDAQSRQEAVVGLAWQPGFRVALVDAATETVVEEATIDTVVGQTVNFTQPLTNAVLNSVVNAAGFITGGYYLKYAPYSSTPVEQRLNYAFFSPPIIGYPTSGAVEIDEQRSGLHSFPDARPPYVLFPFAYSGV